MNKSTIVVGQGEMGGLFSRALLRQGYSVVPIVRGMNMALVADVNPSPELVLVAVAEKDLQPVLGNMPGIWRDRLVLLQNELLPHDWKQHGLDPTVISVWFEKKKGQDHKVIIPSPTSGPHSNTIAAALDSLQIPCRILSDAPQLLHELIIKNLYILTTNITGLRVGGTVGQLWSQHRAFAQQVANEIITLQSGLVGDSLDSQALVNGMLTAFEGDLEHKCMGRTAAARLENALAQAHSLGIDLPLLKEIQAQQVLA